MGRRETPSPPAPSSSRAGLVLAGAGVLCLVEAVLVGTRPMATVGPALLAAPLLGWLVTRGAARALRGGRTVLPVRAAAGDSAKVVVALRGWPLGPGAAALAHVEVDPGADALGTVGAPHVDRDGRVRTVTWEVAALRRGVHDLGPAVVRVRDALGLTVRSVTVADAVTVEVAPRTYPIEAPGSLGLVRAGAAPAARAGGLSEILGVRDHRPGDPLGRIHWPQTARRGRLQTVEVAGGDDDERRALVLLDAGPGTESDAAREAFEVAVSAACSLAASLARRGDLSALAHNGAPAARVSGGAAAEGRVRRALTRVRPGGPTDAAALVRRSVRERGARRLVIVTSAPTPALAAAVSEAVRAGTRTVCVIVGDGEGAAAFAGTRATVHRIADDAALRAFAGRGSRAAA